MAVIISSSVLRDQPGGTGTIVIWHGTHVTVEQEQGDWLEVSAPDLPSLLKGWVNRLSVDTANDSMARIDKLVFATECHAQASMYGVSAHYIAAVATLRTDVQDGQHDAGTGPFAFSTDEWALNTSQPQFQLEPTPAGISSWLLQTTVFAIATRLAQVRLAGLIGSQPTAAELYLSQLVGSKAAIAALQNKQARMVDIVSGIDPISAKADGVDVANLNKRDKDLIGAGSVEDCLKAITTALDAALEISRTFATKAGDQALAAAGVTLAPAGTVGGGINYDSKQIPGGRRDMAMLIAQRFAEAGYGVIQQIAAIANAIAESGLNPAIKAAGKEPSYGLFQLNLNGVGHDHDVDELKNPEHNIAIMLAHMAGEKKAADTAFRATTSLHDAVAIFVREFEKPKNPELKIPGRLAIAQTLLV